MQTISVVAMAITTVMTIRPPSERKKVDVFMWFFGGWRSEKSFGEVQ